MTNGDRFGGLIIIVLFLVYLAGFLYVESLIFGSDSVISTVLGGDVLNWGIYAKFGGGTLLLVVIFYSILFASSKGARERGGEAVGIVWTQMWNAIKDSTKSGILSRIGWLRDKEFKWRIAPGRELPVFVKNRLLMFILLDMCLRLDTFHAKRSTIFYNYIAPNAAVLHNKVLVAPNTKVALEFMRMYRSSPEPRRQGWSYVSARLAEITSEMTKILTKMVIEGRLALREGEIDFTPPLNSFSRFAAEIGGLKSFIDTHYEEFSKRLEAMKALNALKFFKLKNYDMYNVSGKVHAHGFKMVPAGTIVEDENENESVLDAPTEVDLFGNVINDRNATLDRFGKPQGTPRRVKKEERIKITDYDNVPQMLTWMAQDWDAFVRDFRSGELHEQTRNAEDYIREFANKNFDDDRIERHGKGTAFDLRALANPGSFVYWGRIRLEDTPRDIPMENPFPMMSSIGLAKYIDNLIRIKMVSYEEAKRFMRVYPKDLGLPGMRSWLNKEYIVGTLEESPEEARR
ncbi:MAG: hypothetical protein Q8R04_07105 [Nanoarchaeota archaeon]|nr:hypothetical protein [Nanoarchaeota archaeon]